MSKKVFILNNLNCAHCAGKIEKKIKTLPEIENSVFTFATKKLVIESEQSLSVLTSLLQQTCDSIEDGVIVVAENNSKAISRTFILQDLNCAHCAGKIEEKIKTLPQIENSNFTFTTKKLVVESSLPLNELISLLQQTCDSIEDGVTVVAENNSKIISRTFILQDLNCAHCASKIEEKIKTLPQIENSNFTFTTKKLVVESSLPLNELISLLQQTCDSIEDGVTVKLSEENIRKTSYTKNENSVKNDVTTIIIGCVFFIIAVILEHILSFNINIPCIVMYVASYVILGGEILIKAFKNIFKGQVFDENFLMSIATLGAFAIQEFPEAVGVMLFFRIGELFQKIAVEKSRIQIMEAVDLRPEVVNLVNGNTTVTVSAENINVGDILLVRPGDRIPLDGTVIDGESRIDTSAITGESIPVKVSIGSDVVSGCVNTTNVIKIRVDKVLEESMVTKILNSVENASAGKPKIDTFITRFARVYTPIVVTLALITAIVMPLLTDRNFIKWIYTALSFLVMSCPCALVLSVPLAFFSGIGAGSKMGILFKSGISMETLAKIRCVVMDKTGTITKGVFEVQKIVTNDIEEKTLLQLCSSCEQSSTHPVATSIVEYAKSKNIEIIPTQSIEEISGRGIKAEIDNQTVLCGNIELMKSFNIDIKDYNSDISGTQVLIAVNGKYSGCIAISDTVKENAEKSIKSIKKQNIFTAMLTGDEERNAKVVAKSVGIDEVYAELLPQDKVSELQKIREKHGSVMFVGDGINDAPVLAGADVGCAMGSGSDSAIEVADVVFMNSNTDAIPKSIEISKQTNLISIENVIFALAVKIIVMVLGITGIYSNMWLAVFADTGVAMLCILNSIRILFKYRKVR